MLDKLAGVEARFNEIDRQMVDPVVTSDHTKLTELAKERSDIEPIVQAYRHYKKQIDELKGARELVREADDPEMREMAQMEIDGL
ncbi:MAG: PCRF domain-containing protein, partial [Anaerolineae bacterium]|nr:PCRF domain-containing protein [Anaerolineae bacterium]